MAQNFCMELAGAVRDADTFKITVPNLAQARKMLDRLIGERIPEHVKRKLREGKETMNKEVLREVLHLCENEGFFSSLVRDCMQLLEKIEDADSALAMAIKEMKEEYLERALAMCDDFNYKDKAVDVARKLLKNIQKANKLIAKAMKSVDYDLLRKAVKFCEGFNYQSAKAGACSKLYKRVHSTRKQLTAAIKAMEQGALEQAVGACDEKRFNGKVYRCDLEAQARWYLSRVTKINKLAKQAKKECIEEQVRAITKAADAIGMRTSIIDGFRKLIKGPYIKFLDEQFACASKVCVVLFLPLCNLCQLLSHELMLEYVCCLPSSTTQIGPFLSISSAKTSSLKSVDLHYGWRSSKVSRIQ